MRTIDRASAFKRDYKREAKGQHRATLDNDLKPVLVSLATDRPDTPAVSVLYFPFSEATPAWPA
jgi:mRNA-degrading endonuclease YafQ of YafQ-DinJ toxin-antitoxin module